MKQERIDRLLRQAFDAEAKGDIGEAILLFKEASRLGSNDARSKLGTIYDDVLEPRDTSKAVYWYKRGVMGGDSGCAWNMAMHYAGIGRRRWYLYWLKVADTMGDPDAGTELVSNEWWRKRNPAQGV